jgi:hypothetical protein
LLLGEKEAWTPLPWRALEEVPDFLRGRGWVLIGSIYSTESPQGSLDEHLKRFLKRATAGWVAVVLETAAVITVDRSRQRASSYAQAGKPTPNGQSHHARSAADERILAARSRWMHMQGDRLPSGRAQGIARP